LRNHDAAQSERYTEKQMKPHPPPYVPGNTEAERFDNAVRKMLSVSKEDVLKAQEQQKQARTKKRRAKKTA